MKTPAELLAQLKADYPSPGDTVSFNALPEATGTVLCFVNTGETLFVELAGTGQQVTVARSEVTKV